MTMRIRLGSAIGLTAFIALPVSAHAALSIGAGSMSNVTCVHYVCTSTAANAVMNAKRLQNMLASADVKVVAGGGANDIAITTPLSWTSTQRLMLDAPHSITVTKPVNVTGTGALTLTTNDGGSGGTLSFAGGNIHFWDLSSSLIVNGASYTLISNIASLASAIAANPANNFALANAYDATPDGTYTVAAIPTTLTGAFEGLGNTISHLTIKNTTNTGNIGLFAGIGAAGSAENLSITGLYITVTRPKLSYTAANVGGLAGVNAGALQYISVRGAIRSAPGTYPRHGAILFESTGGIAGINNGSIANANAAVTILAKTESYSGGLVGSTDAAQSSSISNSHATGNVTVAGATQTTAGGLVGMFAGAGAISNSTATGTISDSNGFVGYAGGLVGFFRGTTIIGSHATGSVSQADGGGGLAGVNSGTITESYATGNVSGVTIGGGDVGGLVGANQGTIERSFATGTATAYDNARAGGLVGDNDKFNGSAATIVDCYALGSATVGTGAVNSYASAGGLVGHSLNGTMQTSYSTGVPTASTGTSVGGFIGYDQTNTLANAYWDTTTSGITNGAQGAGNIANDPGITGLSDSALKSALPGGFDSGVWGQNGGINNGLPYLLATPPPN